MYPSDPVTTVSPDTGKPEPLIVKYAFAKGCFVALSYL